MTPIKSLFEQAQLAEASYANLLPGRDVSRELQNVGNNMRFSSAQATAFVSQWRVVNHIPDTASGFSATLFERLDTNQQPTGQYTLAIRGSTEFIDFAGADLSLATGGVAFDQLLSMVNYVLRLQAGSNSTTRQVELVAGATAPSLTSNFVSGVGPGINPSQLTISGHSLGGFLGQLYQRIFGSAGVYTYNAFGVIRSNAPIFDQLTNLLGLPSGSFSSGPGENLLVPGEPAQLIGTVQGKPQIRVFSETQSTTIDPINTIPAHKIPPLTDSLAVYDLFAKIDASLNTADPAVGIGRITDILKAGSNRSSNSLEATLDSLRKLFRTPNLTPTAIDNREQYYQNLTALTNLLTTNGTLKPEYQGLTVVDLASKDAFQIEALAFSDIGYRYALTRLNGFAITGSPSLYATHNENGTLDVYNRISGQGSLTADYIADRAAMLGWKNLDYAADGQKVLKGSRPETYQFTDKTLKDANGNDLTLTVRGTQLGTVGNPAKIIFGGDADETLVGGNIAAGDHLYGGGGADVLQGGQGNDYLEGGSGNDTYVYSTGDGFDTIFDVDGKGALVVDGKAIVGGIKVADNDYVSLDKKHFLHTEGNLSTGGVLTIDGQIRVEHFANAELGIVLTDAVSVSELQPATMVFHESFQDNIQFGTDGADRFVAVFVDSLFVGKGGDDLLQVSDGALGPVLVGGAGQDLLIGGSHEGFGTFGGDAGQDILLGGPNSEQILGDFWGFTFSDFGFSGSSFTYSEPSFEDPIDFLPTGFFISPLVLGVTDTDVVFFNDYFQALKYVLGIDDATDISSYYDDYLDGGGGNDILSGGYGSDVLFGGAGNDLLDGDGLTLQFQSEGFRDAAWRAAIVGLFGQPGDDYLDGGAGNDRLFDQSVGNDVFIGGDGNDSLTSFDPSSTESYANYLSGGEGDDRLLAQNLSAGGFDTLIGGPGNDNLTVQSGSAYLEGGQGNDVYVTRFPLATKLIINDYDEGTGGTDRLFLPSGLAPSNSTSDLTITRDESNLYLGFGGVRDRVTIENWFVDDAYKVEEIVFGNFVNQVDTDSKLPPPPVGQIYDVAAIESRFTRATDGADFLWGTAGDDQIFAGGGNDTLTGNEGNDALDGGGGDDHLTGGIGNDILLGGAGDDTYRFGLGYGFDLIDDAAGELDTIELGAGIAPSDVTVSRAQDTLTLAVNGTSDQLSIRWQPQAGYQVEHVEFPDGTVWDAAILEALAGDRQSNTAPPLANPVADPDAGEVLTLTDPGLGSVAQPLTDPGAPTLSEHFTPESTVSDEAVDAFAQLLNDPNFPDMMQVPPTPAIAAGSSNGSVTALTAGSHEPASVETADRFGSRERFEALIEQWFDEARRSAPINLSRIDQIIHGLDEQASGERLEERSGAPDDIVRAWRQTRELLGEHLAREPVAALGYDSADLATALTFSAYGPSQGGISSSAFPSVAQPSGYYLRQFGGLAEGLNQIAA